MATLVHPVNRKRPRRKHCYKMWETLFDIHTKYRPIKPIGRGTYGVVCSSINMDTNEKVAIKKISNVFDDCGDALRTLREMKLLRHVRHENVISLKDVMIPDQRTSFKDVYLVYELMDKDLHRIIKSSKPLSNNHCKLFLVQLLQGLNYLHSANILHRDLKPENLLVNANCDLKICDLGLARENQVDGEIMTEYVVTRWYRAPELLLGCGNYGTSIDVWSVGCLFAEMLGRKPIFPGKDSLHQMKLIISVLGSQKSDLDLIVNPKTKAFIKSLPYTQGTHFSQLYPQADPLAMDLLQKMLVFDPTKRISASEALQHPYMADLCDDQWRNPHPQVPVNLNIDEDWDNKIIREMMWNEMLHYHHEAAFVNA
ncbi:mitogen-activated protein kinase 7 [Medicago truncatula]|uniref:Mitogen-activated protein kinase n=1 Tax=Medicago truncatula TaxID=3880 RepID=G7IV22_MEDTR|nr:mitogen-activated protein kinase 7 [Medicago truncatula]AES70610.1 MAP kinase-like protein [Medicago truncatula]KEH34096.1 MAP kinase-like protein [Medicago truncatula]